MNENQTELVKNIIYQIRKLMQAGEVYTKELNKKYSVSAPQLACLSTLNDYGPLPPSVISKNILVKSSTVTGIIDRLEKKEYVTRVRNSPDRRVINIELTDTGRTLVNSAPSPFQQTIVDGLTRLKSEELEQILAALTKLAHMLDFKDFENNGEDIF